MWNILKYLGNMITNDARCTLEIKSRIVTAKATFNKKGTILTNKCDLNFEEQSTEVLHLEHGIVW